MAEWAKAMAAQNYDRARNRFFLDLHGVLKRDAGRVIRKRLQECCRYGIDLYRGSLWHAGFL